MAAFFVPNTYNLAAPFLDITETSKPSRTLFKSGDMHRSSLPAIHVAY